jgi:hypothetical protein
MSHSNNRRAAYFAAAFLLAGVAQHGAHAQDRRHEFEGSWIWDRDRYVPPPNQPVVHMVAETMSVARDDGARYIVKIVQTYDTGDAVLLDQDIAEDGMAHPVGDDDPPFLLRVSVLPDGGRHIVSGRGKMVHDSVCHVSDGGNTLICTGVHTAEDGSSGKYVCVYHRDRHSFPVAMLSRFFRTPPFA